MATRRRRRTNNRTNNRTNSPPSPRRPTSRRTNCRARSGGGAGPRAGQQRTRPRLGAARDLRRGRTRQVPRPAGFRGCLGGEVLREVGRRSGRRPDPALVRQARSTRQVRRHRTGQTERPAASTKTRQFLHGLTGSRKEQCDGDDTLPERPASPQRQDATSPSVLLAGPGTGQRRRGGGGPAFGAGGGATAGVGLAGRFSRG